MQATLKGRTGVAGVGQFGQLGVEFKSSHFSKQKKMGLFKEQRIIIRRKGRGQKREPARGVINSNKQ